ncbi:hypothetical protein BJ165DRAFT_1479390 [Panaeolus papilionaceus]|nr:hypothetical protein BJ165DRAFT_1479390 [Panaeolus papilionaceus]
MSLNSLRVQGLLVFSHTTAYSSPCLPTTCLTSSAATFLLSTRSPNRPYSSYRTTSLLESSEMSSPTETVSTSAATQQPGRGSWKGRGRGRPWRRGREGKNFSPNTNADAGTSSTENQKPKNPRPTHFVALPLHNHPALSSRIAEFHKALINARGTPATKNLYTSRGKPQVSTLVQGLDSTILIDPIRMHMTLGVMALESDEPTQAGQSSAITGSDETPPGGSASAEPEADTAVGPTEPPPPRKTIATALELLKSLQSQITEILDGQKSVHVPLDHLDVLKTERIRPKKPTNTQQPPDTAKKEGPLLTSDTATEANAAAEVEEKIGAGVLFLGPSADYHKEESGKKLKRICELVNKAFRDANYITETRPLKLHCTILNASHRKPKRWQPFSYSDIVQQPACQMLITGASSTPDSPLYVPAVITRQATAVPIQLGTYPVSSIQIWRMGSHGPNNEYVNCGGIDL